MYALSGIRTHDSNVQASEDSSCIRPRGHCDQHIHIRILLNKEFQKNISCSLRELTWILL
jgi:hypothetical protein